MEGGDLIASKLAKYESEMKRNQPIIDQMRIDLNHIKERISELNKIIQKKTTTPEIQKYLKKKSEISKLKDEKIALDTNLKKIQDDIAILNEKNQEKLFHNYQMCSKLNLKVENLNKEIAEEQKKYEDICAGRSDNEEINKLAIEFNNNRRELSQLSSRRDNYILEIRKMTKIILEKYNNLN